MSFTELQALVTDIRIAERSKKIEAELDGTQQLQSFQSFLKLARLLANVPFGDSAGTGGTNTRQPRRLSGSIKKKVGGSRTRCFRDEEIRFMAKKPMSIPCKKDRVILDSRVLKWEELVLQIQGATSRTTVVLETATSSRSSAPFTPPTSRITVMQRASRRKIAGDELVKMRKEIPLEKNLVYVGRVPSCEGYPSAWAKSYKRGTHVSRDGVVKLCQQHVMDSEITKGTRKLEGKTPLSHCSTDEG